MSNNQRERLISILAKAPLLKEYVEFQKPMSRAPEEFHIATMIQIISSIMDRRIYLRQGTDKIYPNLFTMIVAPSSRYKKSSSAGNYTKWLETLELGQYYLGHIGTIEGLCSALQHDNLSGKGLSFYDEFGSFFANLNKSYAIDMIDTLNDLYGCNPLRKTYKKESYHVPEPYFNLFGATQLDSLSKHIDEGALLSGFLPRFFMVYSETLKPHIPLRPSPDMEKYNRIKAGLMDIVRVMENLGSNEIEIKLSSECIEPFCNWSIRMDEKAATADNRISTIIGRCETLAFKLAIILMAANGKLGRTNTIPVGIMKNAQFICEWSIQQYSKLVLSKLTFNEYTKNLQRAETIIKKKKIMALHEIRTYLKIPIDKCEEIMAGFVQSGMVIMEKGDRGGIKYTLNE